MEVTKCRDVIKLLNESTNYFYNQEKLYIFKDGKTYIIHNVNQKSYEYIMYKSKTEIPTFSTPERKKGGKFWSEEEEKILRNNIEAEIEKLVVLLPARGKHAIKNKIYAIKKNLWKNSS